MEKRTYTRGQISKAVSTGIFLTSFGGFQDAYTYCCRGGVFANAQTGSIVLMGGHPASREWGTTLRYMAPVAVFACGAYMAERIRRQHKHNRQFHWRQMAMAIGIIPLFLIGLMSRSMNMTANITVSSVCAMQVNALCKIKGSPCTTTMCIGDLRNGMERFHTYRHAGSPESRDQHIRYHGVVIISLVGAALGAVLTARLTGKAIWISCGLLSISFLIMFLQEDMGGRERAQ